MAEENFDEHDTVVMAEENSNEHDTEGMAEENFNEHDKEGMAEENFEEHDTEGMAEENFEFEEHDTEGMAEENFEEHDTVGMPENSHPPEVQGSEKDSGGVGEKKWPGWPGENVFRMLVPVQKVGGIIGRKGEYIKKTCEETKARIKILDGPGSTERVVSFCVLKGSPQSKATFQSPKCLNLEEPRSRLQESA